MHKPAVMNSKAPQIITAFIISALIVLFVLLFSAKHEEPQYELTIKELGGTSMLAISESEELGLGEILLVYSDDMIVRDVNGQEIDYAELSVADRISVDIAPREKDPDYDRYLDPVIETITLLPVGSDEYI